MNKGAQFLATRIGQDAVLIADLIGQIEGKDARIAELEAEIEKLKPKEEPKV